MRLRPDTVDRNTLASPLPDFADQAIELCVVGAVKVVVINVELRVWIGSSGGFESNPDILLSQDFIEYRLTHSAIFVEDLVYDIPGVNLASVTTHEGGNTVLDNVGQIGGVSDVLNPLGQLRVPDESVTTDELAVGGSVVNESVCAGERESTAGGLSGIPLERVFRRHLTHFGLEDLVDLGEGECVLIGSSAQVFAAVGTHGGVERRGCSFFDLVSLGDDRGRKGRAGDEESGEEGEQVGLHCEWSVKREEDGVLLG